MSVTPDAIASIIELREVSLAEKSPLKKFVLQVLKVQEMKSNRNSETESKQ